VLKKVIEYIILFFPFGEMNTHFQLFFQYISVLLLEADIIQSTTDMKIEDDRSKIFSVNIEGIYFIIQCFMLQKKQFLVLILKYFTLIGETHKIIPVKIVDISPKKPFLGGFRHKLTGVEYLNASCQTFPKKILASQVIIICVNYFSKTVFCFQNVK